MVGRIIVLDSICFICYADKMVLIMDTKFADCWILYYIMSLGCLYLELATDLSRSNCWDSWASTLDVSYELASYCRA